MDTNETCQAQSENYIIWNGIYEDEEKRVTSIVKNTSKVKEFSYKQKNQKEQNNYKLN